MLGGCSTACPLHVCRNPAPGGGGAVAAAPRPSAGVPSASASANTSASSLVLSEEGRHEEIMEEGLHIPHRLAPAAMRRERVAHIEAALRSASCGGGPDVSGGVSLAPPPMIGAQLVSVVGCWETIEQCIS